MKTKKTVGPRWQFGNLAAVQRAAAFLAQEEGGGRLKHVFDDDQGQTIGEDFDGGKARCREMAQLARQNKVADKLADGAKIKPKLCDPEEHGKSGRGFFGLF